MKQSLFEMTFSFLLLFFLFFPSCHAVDGKARENQDDLKIAYTNQIESKVQESANYLSINLRGYNTFRKSTIVNDRSLKENFEDDTSNMDSNDLENYKKTSYSSVIKDKGGKNIEEDQSWEIIAIEEYESDGDITTLENLTDIDRNMITTFVKETPFAEENPNPIFNTMQTGPSNTCKLRLSVYIAPAQFASIQGQIFWTLYTPFGPTATFPGALREFVRGKTYSVQVHLKNCYGELIAVRGDLKKTSVELLIGNIKVDVLYPYRKTYRTETPDNISLIPPYPTTVPLEEYIK